MSMWSPLLCCCKRVFALTSAFSCHNFMFLPCFILYSKAKFASYSNFACDFLLLHSSPYNEWDIFWGVSSRRSCRSSQNHSTSASSVSVVGAQTWITMMLNGWSWKQTELILSFLKVHSSIYFRFFC